MNPLTQLESGIVGDVASVDALARKAFASILVLSDTHGHYPLFQRIVLKYGPASDALIFAGDGMWDVVRYLENAHGDERYRAALPPVLAFVAGNGDGDRYRVCPDGMEGGSADGISGAAGLTGTSGTGCEHGYPLSGSAHPNANPGGPPSHGNHFSVDIGTEVLVNVAKASGCDIAVFGHTHMPLSETVSNVLAVNPGSPARPRGYSAPGFVLLQLESGKNSPIVQFKTV